MHARSEGCGASPIFSTVNPGLDGLAEVANFGVFAAADHLEQNAERSGVGNLERVEVADRRELPLPADRQPVIEHARMLAPLGRRNRPKPTSRGGLRPLRLIHFTGAPIFPLASTLAQATFGSGFLEKVKVERLAHN